MRVAELSFNFGKLTVNVAAGARVALAPAPTRAQIATVMSFRNSLPLALVRRLEELLSGTQAAQSPGAEGTATAASGPGAAASSAMLQSTRRRPRAA